MRLGNLDITFHRTVRVAEGCAVSNLPPSLGRMKLHKVQDYRTNWKESPTAVFAFYLVDAATAEEITGEKVQAPTNHDHYSGPWFGLDDEKLGDVAGTAIFSGLKSAAFPASDVKEESETEPVCDETKVGA
jgi:hypothetical protein